MGSGSCTLCSVPFCIAASIFSLLHRGSSLQQILRKFDRFFNPRTPVAEGAYSLRKQTLGRSIMKIDIVFIRQYKLQSSKRIQRSGLLPEPVVRILPRDAGPVDCIRDLLSLPRGPNP